MFKYQRELLENRLEILNEEFQQQNQLNSKYQDESYHIGSYLEKKRFILRHQLAAVLCSIIGCVCLPISLLTNITYLIYVLITFGLTGYEIVNVSKNKKRIQCDYSDLCNVDYDELLCRLHDVNEKLYQLSNEKYEVYTKISNCKNQLKELNHYERISKFLTSQEGILLSADTEEEYYALQREKKENFKRESANFLNDYLEEKIQYSNIHFSNSIEENIEYSENSKKLIKRV